MFNMLGHANDNFPNIRLFKSIAFCLGLKEIRTIVISNAKRPEDSHKIDQWIEVLLLQNRKDLQGAHLRSGPLGFVLVT